MIEPQPRASAARDKSHQFDQASPDDEAQALIRRVLEATPSPNTEVTQAELLAMLDIAVNHREETDVRNVATVLVAALLHTNYSRLSLPPGSLDAIAGKLGDTLCESPSTLPRLQRLWDHLRSLTP